MNMCKYFFLPSRNSNPLSPKTFKPQSKSEGFLSFANNRFFMDGSSNNNPAFMGMLANPCKFEKVVRNPKPNYV